MYYPCSENKGADQLRGYREADLRLCFRICKKPVFSRHGSYDKRDDFDIVNFLFLDLPRRPSYAVYVYLNLLALPEHCRMLVTSIVVSKAISISGFLAINSFHEVWLCSSLALAYSVGIYSHEPSSLCYHSV